jgi:adenosylmethionine-8-amino-7-oxononanoate aminotransferase
MMPEIENIETLRRADLNHLWHPFTQMKEWSAADPLFIASGEGNTLIDSEGNRYLDGVSSLWANIHGHGRKEINDAIKAQLERIAHSTLLGLSHPLAAALAERLSGLAPGDLRWVFYSESGSAAVEIALKMAYQYWQNLGKTGKKRFICLKEGYHGDTLGSVSVGGIDLFHEVYGPLLFESIKAPSPYRFCQARRIALRDGTAPCVAALADILAEHAHETAALILEPMVQGAGGILTFPPGYLKQARDLCRQHQVLFIADEVAVGFGRTGTLFACEQEGVEPDFLCLGKGITGGYLPLAATLATDEVFQAFWQDYEKLMTFFHGHTYTGNPLACAAAMASLDLFEKDHTLETLAPKIERLRLGLQRLSTLAPVGDTRQCGLMSGVEIFRDPTTREPYPVEMRMGHKVCMAIRKHGVILRNLSDVIVILPPLTISLTELDHIIASLEKSIREICG